MKIVLDCSQNLTTTLGKLVEKDQQGGCVCVCVRERERERKREGAFPERTH